MAEDVQGQAAKHPNHPESSEATDRSALARGGDTTRRRRSSSARPTPPTRRSGTGSAEDKFPDCFKEYADLLHWDQPWHTTLDTSNAPFWKWFVGGKLNASLQLRRPARWRPIRNKTAIDLGARAGVRRARAHHLRRSCYRQVNEFAALLRDFCGLKAGDRVTLHMPMVAELPVTMLACARLGVIHSQVFGGFSGTRLRRAASPTRAAAS